MHLRRCYRKQGKTRHTYWVLVESYRTARGPRPRVVGYLGEMDEAGHIGVQQAAQPTLAQGQDVRAKNSNQPPGKTGTYPS